MADRYLSDYEDEDLEGRSVDGPRARHTSARPKRKRRIRMTKNGLPGSDTDSLSRSESSSYETEYTEGPRERVRQVVERPVRERSTREYDEYETEYAETDSDYGTHEYADDTRDYANDYDEPVRQRRALGRSLGQRDHDRGSIRSRMPSLRMPGGRRTSGGRRMPQLPIRGGLADVVGRGRAAMAIVMGLLALVGYSMSTDDLTAEGTVQGNGYVSQPVSQLQLNSSHELALGQKSVRQMVARYSGLTRDESKRSIVQQIGAALASQSDAAKSGYTFSFDVLGDDRIGAFALPGGQVYVTAGLMNQLKTKGEIAAILAVEMAHVIQRHGLARLASHPLPDGNLGEVVMASFVDPVTYNPSSKDVNELISQTVMLQYTASEVYDADRFGLYYMVQAGFHPESLVTALQRVKTLKANGRPNAFAARHPSISDEVALIQREFGKYQNVDNHVQ